MRAIRHLANHSQRGAQQSDRAIVLPQQHEVFCHPRRQRDRIGQADLFPYLAKVGSPAPTMRRRCDKMEAEQACRDLGPRVVMKIDTARVVHKSDAGGVTLGVTPETAPQASEHLRACLDPPLGTHPGEAVVVAPQLDSGIEVFIGAKQDEGAAVTCSSWD